MGEDVKITDYVKHGGFNNIDWPNCIDPAVFYDADGKMWMVYGSWSGGIFLLELDEETGYPIHPETDEADNVNKYYGKRLCGGGHNSIEGQYIQYDEKSGYYYLLVSYGGLNRDGELSDPGIPLGSGGWYLCGRKGTGDAKGLGSFRIRGEDDGQLYTAKSRRELHGTGRTVGIYRYRRKDVCGLPSAF